MEFVHRKRQHVCCLVLFAIVAIQRADRSVARKQNRNFASQSNRRFCAGQETAQLPHLQRSLTPLELRWICSVRGVWLDQNHKGKGWTFCPPSYVDGTAIA